MRPLWFKAKTYGWGWYPCTWQGWLVVLLFVVGVAANTFGIDNAVASPRDVLLHTIPVTVVLVVFLIIICYLTGEKPRWRWGKED